MFSHGVSYDCVRENLHKVTKIIIEFDTALNSAGIVEYCMFLSQKEKILSVFKCFSYAFEKS